MKTLEEIKDLMVGKSVITNLADLLRANDEEYAESEKKYLAAVETLRSELSTEFTPTLDEYLAACESDVISGVAYAGYLGFRVNLENFHHPIGIDFVRLDTIDYLKDHLFGHFPVNYRNAHVREAFNKSLPAAFEQLQDDIQDYFTHMECAGPKLAHYAGYIIGNHITSGKTRKDLSLFILACHTPAISATVPILICGGIRKGGTSAHTGVNKCPRDTCSPVEEIMFVF